MYADIYIVYIILQVNIVAAGRGGRWKSGGLEFPTAGIKHFNQAPEAVLTVFPAAPAHQAEGATPTPLC